MYRIILFTLAFSLYFATKAQIVNVENKRLYSDSLGWSGSVSASFSYAQNKYQFFTSSFMPHAQWRGEKSYVLAFGSSELSKSSTTTFTNSHLAHLRYWHTLKGKSKWEIFCQIQYNPLINLKLREIIGTGIRLELVNKEKSKVFAGTSYMLEYEDIQPDNIYNLNNRWSNYFSWFLETENNISFSGVTYFQPRIDKFKDFRLSCQASIITKIKKNSQLKFNFNMMYDKEPPQNVRNLILSSNLALAFLIGK